MMINHEYVYIYNIYIYTYDIYLYMYINMIYIYTCNLNDLQNGMPFQKEGFSSQNPAF
jgi:hypothetical protein